VVLVLLIALVFFALACWALFHFGIIWAKKIYVKIRARVVDRQLQQIHEAISERHNLYMDILTNARKAAIILRLKTRKSKPFEWNKYINDVTQRRRD